MPHKKFIIREPLLDPKHQVIGYRLSWQQRASNPLENREADLNALAAFAGTHLKNPETGWLLRDRLLYLEMTPALLASDVVQTLHPNSTILSLAMAEQADEQTPVALKALRAQGFRIALRFADAVANQALLPYATHLELGSVEVRSAAQIKARVPSIRLVATQAANWEEYEACAALGMEVFAGRVYLAPPQQSKRKGLNAAQSVILQLMELVRNNADSRELEAVMKRDAALSYRLFRYINSVGFGLGAEIQSLRHAVTMLGYSTLYRWLSLLLATAADGHNAAVLMQTAIIRARFAELLGQGLMTKSDAENLFVAGMFSVLDRLLGIPMEDVLEQIHLPNEISEALLHRTGVYGPFLALIEACETGDSDAKALADSLFIETNQVNEAHLSAMAWAQSLSI